MRLNIEKRKNPFGGSDTVDVTCGAMHPGQKEIAQVHSGSGFVKFVPMSDKSPFDKVIDGMQKAQETHGEFEKENFKTFYCHVCMGPLGIYDECNDNLTNKSDLLYPSKPIEEDKKSSVLAYNFAI